MLAIIAVALFRAQVEIELNEKRRIVMTNTTFTTDVLENKGSFNLTDDELSEVTGGAPSESLTLNFTKVSFSYQSQGE